MNVQFIATILLSVILTVSGVLHLVATPLGWKRGKIGPFTLFFLSEKRWEQPIAKIFNIAWALIQYSIGFSILITKVL